MVSLALSIMHFIVLCEVKLSYIGFANRKCVENAIFMQFVYYSSLLLMLKSKDYNACVNENKQMHLTPLKSKF